METTTLQVSLRPTTMDGEDCYAVYTREDRGPWNEVLGVRFATLELAQSFADIMWPGHKQLGHHRKSAEAMLEQAYAGPRW